VIQPAKEVFAENLRRVIETSRFTPRQVADRAGVNYTTLKRWLDVGVRAPDGRTRQPLERVCRVLRVAIDDLWKLPRPHNSAIYPQQVEELFQRWEELEVDDGELAGLLDCWCAAGRVVEAFRKREPDLVAVIANVKSLSGPGDVQRYLEGLVREWNLDEAEASRRLVETTQRFLAAALPHDPQQLGLWFIDVHPQRWKRLLKVAKLDNEGELFAFARHMMAEGLSSLEAYEAILRLSNK
jgi:hypothetical protein